MSIWRPQPVQPPYQPQPLNRPPAQGIVVPTAAITEGPLPANHAGPITVHVVGSNTSFTSSTTWTASGLGGTWAVFSKTFVDATHYTVVLTPPAAATPPAGATGTLTLTEGVTGSTAPTVTVGTPTLALSPTSGTVGTTPTLTLTGVNSIWTTETPLGLFTESGGTGASVATPTVSTDTSATAVLTVGSSATTLTVTDASTGATATFTATAISGTITVTNPKPYRGLWKNGSGQANIPIAGTYTGGPGTLTIEASFNGGAYATVATGSGGTFSGTLIAQAAGQGALTVRFVFAPSINATVANVTIAPVIVIAGQSNAVGQLNNLQTYTNGVGLHAVVFAAGNSSFTSASFWQDGNDPFAAGVPTGSPWPLLATHLMRYLGGPVIFIETAIGGRGLVANNWYWTKWRPDTGQPGDNVSSPIIGYGEITNTITTAATGGVDAVVWYQGENDVDASIVRHVYAQAFGTFADQVNADFANGPKLAVVQFGYNGQGGVPTSTADGIKLALADAVNAGGSVLNGMVVVSDYSNGLHILTDAEAQKCADRMFAVLKSEVFGGTAGAGRGPRVTACQYNAARTAVTVCFDKVLKTGLTFATGAWAVSGNGTPATVTAVNYHATNTSAVVLTLSGAVALPITVSFGLGSPAGLVVPLGPDFALPSPAGTINLPAEMFSGVTAAFADGPGGGGGGAILSRILTGM